jgi:hypothetical protein
LSKIKIQSCEAKVIVPNVGKSSYSPTDLVIPIQLEFKEDEKLPGHLDELVEALAKNYKSSISVILTKTFTIANADVARALGVFKHEKSEETPKTET